MSVNADELIKAVSGGGMDALNSYMDALPQKAADSRAAAQQEQKERERLAYKAAALFSSPEGREVLEVLLDASLRRVTFDIPQMTDPMTTLVRGAFREGQNAIVAHLLQLIGEGGGLKTVDTEKG
jgi:hypothetical protein